jgi:hypothetical protein
VLMISPAFGQYGEVTPTSSGIGVLQEWLHMHARFGLHKTWGRSAAQQKEATCRAMLHHLKIRELGSGDRSIGDAVRHESSSPEI